jgi:hypothetical protein
MMRDQSGIVLVMMDEPWWMMYLLTTTEHISDYGVNDGVII